MWQYRDLILLFTKRTFTVQYKQTVLGPAWLFLNPIISSLIYCFVFGGLAGMGTDGIPQILFYMSGNAIWGYFSTCLSGNATTFNANANVFGKVYFPRLATPISNVLSSVIKSKIGEQRLIGQTFMALNGIDLTVYKGEALGIIGGIGVGKSTMLKLLSRVNAPTEAGCGLTVEHVALMMVSFLRI